MCSKKLSPAQLLLLSCAHRFKIRPSVIIIFIPTVICRLHCSLPAEVVVSYAPFLFHQKGHPTLKTYSLASFSEGNPCGAIEPLFSGSEKRSGSIARNLLKGNPSENLVLSDRCLLWKTQRFDSTKFLKGRPSETLVLSNRSVIPFPFIFDHWNKALLLVLSVSRSPSFHNNRRATLLTYSLAPFRFLFFHRQKKPHFVNLSCGPVPFSLQQNMTHHVFKLFSGIFPCLPSPKNSTRQIANLGP